MDKKPGFELGESFALMLDSTDPLVNYKNRFYSLPGNIYMDGNSLGLMSVDSEKTLMRVINEWKTLGIKGWEGAHIPWISYAEKLGEMQAPLVGAEPTEIVLSGGTTINLHALVSSFYQPRAERSKILADELNFPSDLYALNAQIKLKGREPKDDLLLVKSRDGLIIEEEDIIDAMTEEVQLALFPSVNYRSGQLLDMKNLTKEAHDKGIIIGFDCSHSVGVIPHKFKEWGIDFAFWCNYKYMNGGPGSTGSLYVNKKHFGTQPGLAGWFGNDRSSMFEMRNTFEPAKTATAWEIGTTTMLSTAPIEGSLKIINESGIYRIREKSIKITSYLIFLIDELLSKSPYEYGVVTPRDPKRRGGHVGVTHKEAWKINQALIARGVIPDFRPPNIIRLAPIPLYISYRDVWLVSQHLKEVIDFEEYKKFSKEKGTVT
jgi:kynureninase